MGKVFDSERHRELFENYKSKNSFANAISYEMCKSAVYELFGKLVFVDKVELSKYGIELHIVRHGKDEEDKIGGWSDNHLTREGINEIEMLKEKLDDEYDVFISSDLIRAKESSYILNEKLKMNITFDDHFRETNNGVLCSAGFHDFDTEEERWAYWSKMIYLNRYKFGAKDLYKRLLKLVENKDYFVITTNVDHQFQLAGFDKKRLFYMQGDYGLFQCSKPCSNDTYDNKDYVFKMIESINNNRIPTSLVPKCPKCGRVMTTNLRCDDTFVEDMGWHNAKNRYDNFIQNNKDKKILFLELGVGFSTPVWIKYPFILSK